MSESTEQHTKARAILPEHHEASRLPGSTRILRADNGADTTLDELTLVDDHPEVWSLNKGLRMVARSLADVHPCGREQIFSLRLASGREVMTTRSSSFLTVDGWISLEGLTVGDRLAIPRYAPEPDRIKRMVDAEVILLAHMIGDGSFVKRQPLRYASVDEENLAAVTIAARHFGVTAIRDDYAAARVTSLRLPAPYRLARGKRNPIAEWLDGLGLFGLRSYEKFVPERIFALPTDQVALFLRHLWATDGSVRWDVKGHQARIYYTSTSRRLIDDVAQLLLRFGVHTRIRTVPKLGYRDSWHLVVEGGSDQLTFVKEIGVHGQRGVATAEVLLKLEPQTRNTNVDTVPKEVWNRVRDLLANKRIPHRDFQAAMGNKFCGSTMWKHSPSRSRLARAAAILEDAKLEMLATSDVFWDRVAEITALGEQRVFGIRVLGSDNVVAQGISIHI
ncbi:LAGLIDADG family homing endonuclease [Nocardia sp. NPDC127526]|uniref:LAGLIDADG family homing endonuclease n=1 Tax=Nocardia sp. NPDC127526 TaxID=3345393 RepID=UPI003641B724